MSICLHYLNYWHIALKNTVSSFSDDMACSHVHNIQTSLKILPDKLMTFLFFLFLTTNDSWPRAELLALLVFSTLHSSSFRVSFQQRVMCQLQKLNKPDNTALALQRTCFILNLPLLAKVLQILFPTHPTSGSVPASVFCLFI